MTDRVTRGNAIPTGALVRGLCHQDGVLVLGPPVDVVDVVGAVVRVVYPLPAEGELALVTVFRSLLLHSGQARVEPVRGACNTAGLSATRQ